MITLPTIHTLSLDESTPPTALIPSKYKLPTAPGRTPTEILFAIGQFLNKPSLLASLRVSQHWNTTLQPFLWETISEKYWHHPEFPISQHPPTTASTLKSVSSSTDDSSLAPCFVRVRSMTWFSNLQMTTFYRTPLLPEIPLDRLAHILTMTVHLTSLTLSLHLRNPAPAFFDSLRNLHRLKRLLIGVDTVTITNNRSPMIPIFYLFPLFKHLDELSLRGPFYTLTSCSTEATLHPTETPWTLKRFTYDHADLRLLRYCPHLEYFCLMFPTTWLTPSERDQVWKTSMRPYLSQLSRLTELILDNFRLTRHVSNASLATTTSATTTASASTGHRAKSCPVNDDWLILADPDGPFWSPLGTAWFETSDVWAEHGQHCIFHQ